MFIHFLKIAIRNLVRHKLTSVINILGLAIGMTCAVLIFLWVNHQLEYDQWVSKKNQIYRLENQTWVVMPPYLGETVSVFPEVESAVRFYFWYEPVVKYEDNVFTVKNFALVDSTVFNVFDFKFKTGDPEKSLISPFSIVLTESTARKLFGDEYALDKTILVDNKHEYNVTGVIEDIENFHMDINAFACVNDINRIYGNKDFLNSRNNNFSIYLLLVPDTDVSNLVDKINERAVSIDEYASSPLLLRPFNDIYFARNLQHEKNTKHGNMQLILAFSIIAVLILLIACINFVNLTIAESKTREMEIAVRKSSGAVRESIQHQFFIETFVITFIAFLFAVLCVDLFLPAFNLVTGENIHPNFFDLKLISIFIGIFIATVLISGIYPSFYLASLKPIALLKGSTGKGKKDSIFSKTLVTIQFSIAILLIISTLMVFRQLNFMQNKDLGMDHDHMLSFSLQGDKFEGTTEKILANKETFKQRLIATNDVLAVTYVNQIPGKITNTWTWTKFEEENGIPLRIINADPDFIDFMNLEILKGRNFSYDIQTDMSLKFLINEEAVRQLELENPVGSTFNNDRIQIIGVVKDFHFNSLHSKIEPLGISWDYWTVKACARLTGKNLSSSIKSVEKVFKEFCPGYAFEYVFLNDTFEQQYKAEKRLEILLRLFVMIAIILSCLGLFALSTFVTRQRTKEIGIRKVFGSSNKEIVLLVIKNFIKWVILANVIAWPIAYLLIKDWLQSFAYHININFFIFIFSGVLAIIIAFVTVGYQALKASYSKPVDSLRYE